MRSLSRLMHACSASGGWLLGGYGGEVDPPSGLPSFVGGANPGLVAPGWSGRHHPGVEGREAVDLVRTASSAEDDRGQGWPKVDGLGDGRGAVANETEMFSGSTPAGRDTKLCRTFTTSTGTMLDQHIIRASSGRSRRARDGLGAQGVAAYLREHSCPTGAGHQRQAPPNWSAAANSAQVITTGAQIMDDPWKLA